MEKKDHKPQVIFKSQQFPAREKEKYFIVETIAPSSHENKVIEGPIDVVQKVTNETNKLIESKKLQFNDIWTNKITQEDLYTPKLLQEQNETLFLNRILFNSIVKYAAKINNMFILLSQEKDNAKILEYSNNILIVSLCLQMKMRNFLQVKSVSFKIDLNQLIPLSNSIQWFKCLLTQLQKEAAIQIKEIYTSLYEFKNLLSNCN